MAWRAGPWERRAAGLKVRVFNIGEGVAGRRPRVLSGGFYLGPNTRWTPALTGFRPV